MREPKPKVLVDADETELETLVARKGRRRRFVVDDLGVDQAVVPPAVGHDAAAGGQHIAVPGGVRAKGPWHDEGVAQRAHAQGRGVRPPRPTTPMVKDADDGIPSPSRDQQDGRIDEESGEADYASSAWPQRGRVNRRISIHATQTP